jgi:integrase
MGRQTTGTLINRHGHWSLRFIHNGKAVTRALHTQDQVEAERQRDRIMLPLRLADEKDCQLALLASIQGTEIQRIGAEREAAESERGISLAAAFPFFVQSPARPQCGEGQLGNYHESWTKLTRFLADKHPEARTVDDILSSHVAEFCSDAGMSSLSPNTFNQTLGRLRTIYGTLCPGGMPGDGPFDGVREKKRQKNAPSTGRRELSEAELRCVCAAAEGEYRTMLAIGLYTALRMGDAATLRWEEVNFDQGFIARVAHKTGKLVKVPLHAELRAMLEAGTPKQLRGGFVLPSIGAAYSKDRRRVSAEVQDLFKGCGLAVQARNAGQKNATCVVGFHSLRHSFVTICAKAGVPLGIVQELCGHGSPAIQRAYLHMGDAAGKAIAALPSLATPTPLESGACCKAWEMGTDTCSASDQSGRLIERTAAGWRAGYKLPAVRFCPWCGRSK